MDYQSFDPNSHRLYISKMGAGKLLVFDTDANKLVFELGDFPKATGVLAVAELNKVYVSAPGAGLLPTITQGMGIIGLSSGRGAVAILDTESPIHELARVPAGVFPDGITYDPTDHKIFVSDELGSAVTVINADTNQLITRIKMKGEVGNVRYNERMRKVYAPIQTRNQLAAIDPVKNSVTNYFSLPAGHHPHGLIISADQMYGYVACDGNDLLLTVNLQTGKVLNQQPLAHDPDVLTLDAGLARLYVASESGGLSTFNIANADSPVSMGNVYAGSNAHSVEVDPSTHKLYLPLAHEHGRSVLRILLPKGI